MAFIDKRLIARHIFIITKIACLDMKKEVEIGGKIYFLLNLLTESELKLIDHGSRFPGKTIVDQLIGREPENELLGKQLKLTHIMERAFVAKCYGLPFNDVRKLKTGDLWKLYDNLIEKSRPAKR
jgi:hypothetical protein